ncbi:DNA segregation ATPase FtsK/SpoIIIE and related proteins [Streptococcus suis]|nr:DNA segregation ATPase FtsK/SpoIIIE and related proteins [Streptococcus suis]
MRKTSKKGKATRRPTKAELAQQERVKNITLRVLGLLFIAFAASRLGVFGVTSYNIFRLLFGSLAYLLLAGCIYLPSYSQSLTRKRRDHIGLLADCYRVID